MGKAGPSRSRRKSKQEREVPYSTQDSSQQKKVPSGQSIGTSQSTKNSSKKAQKSSPVRSVLPNSSPLPSPVSTSKRRKTLDLSLSCITDDEISEAASMYSVEVSNKFNALSESNVADGQVNKENPQAESGPRIRKPPPIVITEEIKNSHLFFKKLRNLITEDFEIKCVSSPNFCKTYIRAKNPNDFKAIVNNLKSLSVQFYTYGLKNEIPNKVILKGLHPTVTAADIKKELSDLGYLPLDVIQFNKKGTNVKIPVFLIIFDSSLDLKNVYNLKVICFTKVSWEKYHGINRSVRCYRCQGFNHISINCNVEMKCRRCAGPHSVQECSSKKLKCANCNQEHEASDPNCQIKQKALDRKNSRVPRNGAPPPDMNSASCFPVLSPSGGPREQPNGTPHGGSNKKSLLYSHVTSRKSVQASGEISPVSSSTLQDLISLLNNPLIKELLEKLVCLLKLLSRTEDGDKKVSTLLGEGFSLLS